MRYIISIQIQTKAMHNCELLCSELERLRPSIPLSVRVYNNSVGGIHRKLTPPYLWQKTFSEKFLTQKVS